ncbi:MAG: hypothetical protein GY786_11035 [Proteobacteria bacterium]|nr:hypothetical protein [Pseudomonadota bacterium]
MSKSNFIPPKYELLENLTEGQGFSHELPVMRDWGKTLDAIHLHMLDRWYYVATATNSRKSGGLNKILKNDVNLDRQKQEIPTDLKTILTMRLTSFNDLNTKIKGRILGSGGSNKDVWMFRTKWAEFPKGTMVIELYQRFLRNSVAARSLFRRAFVILDGKCSSGESNDTMLRIRKIFNDKAFAKKVVLDGPEIERNLDTSPSLFREEPEIAIKEVKVRDQGKKGRLPGGLVVELLDDFSKNARSLTAEEMMNLYHYLENLKNRGETAWWHEELVDKLDSRMSRSAVEEKLRQDKQQFPSRKSESIL